MAFANNVLNKTLVDNIDNNADAVSGITATAESIGCLIGPLVGGFLNDIFGF